VTANAYSFLPWLRTGIATRITADPGTASRASIPVKLRLTGTPVAGGDPVSRMVEQAVQIYGPGDVVGVDSRAVSRTEPRPWITNVEPNYLVHIEFYDEDLPWRYSPAAPDAGTNRLSPWLALVVLAGGNDPQNSVGAEFTEGALPGRPLPFITVLDPAATLPLPEQLGAWAHVHVNGGLDVPVASDDMAAVLPALQDVLNTNADNACSRLFCPRHLLPNTTYHAFLVPAFETGRLAGLGLDPAKAPGALYPSWGRVNPDYSPQASGQLPYYYRWFFGTGSAGDFEALVELLQPRKPDERVGRRDFDVHLPAGPGLPGITTPAGLGGVLRLGGALQVPKRPEDVWDRWDDPPPPKPPQPPDPSQHYPHPFQQALAGLINLADEYLDKPPAAAHADLRDSAGPVAAALADEVDPIITPPLYGRWHALTSRLLYEPDGTPIPAPANRNWVHRLNLDPRFRIAANFGTQVVQRRQEEFMAAAWAQVGDVLEANNRIRAAQLAREVGHALKTKHLDPLTTPAATPAGAVAGAAPPAPALPSGRALTVTAPASSRVTPSGAAGPAGALASGLTELVENFAVGFQVATSQVTAAPLSPAMRRITRPGSRLMRSLFATQPADTLLARMDAASGAVTAAATKTTPSAVVTPTELNEVLHPPPPPPPHGAMAAGSGGDPVDQLPVNKKFVLSLPEEGIVHAPGGDEDSNDARLFKDALRDLNRGSDAAAVGGQAKTPERLGVAGVTGLMLNNLRADRTVPKSLLSSVRLPERLKSFAERFVEAMAYPVIDLPMYEALLQMSVDVFVPNLNLIPPNTITLLKTNQEFIEAYLVGLNHELARELLWREYPTDQRCTPFRQFWDVHTVISPPNETPDQRRERLYDIKPIHSWKPEAELGHNDNRETGPDQEEELVLVIRGELLKKYPTAAIYAQKAEWTPKDDGSGQPDPTRERTLGGEIRMPIYGAKIEPDIYLLGFDLTESAARGKPPPGDAGWFFVIQERPGDPRFGADVDKHPDVEVWNDLSWPDVDPANHGFIQLDPATEVALKRLDEPDADPTDDQEKEEQQRDDLALPRWHSKLSSADIAYMLFQAPVLMAVHAQEMLP
jgi:hypothetical protein